MIAEPPLLEGAVNVTETVVLLVAVAGPIVGAPGTVAGVTLLDAAEAALLPAAFVANTVQVTAVPFVKPVTVRGEPAPEAVCPPHVAV